MSLGTVGIISRWFTTRQLSLTLWNCIQHKKSMFVSRHFILWEIWRTKKNTIHQTVKIKFSCPRTTLIKSCCPQTTKIRSGHPWLAKVLNELHTKKASNLEIQISYWYLNYRTSWKLAKWQEEEEIVNTHGHFQLAMGLQNLKDSSTSVEERSISPTLGKEFFYWKLLFYSWHGCNVHSWSSTVWSEHCTTTSTPIS
jgi:hypothetical protein